VCAAAQNGSNENRFVSVTYLKDIVFRAIRTFGYTEEEAQSLQDVMMYAQLRGNNQGIIKITTGGIVKPPGSADAVIEHETKLSALIDGKQNSGMLALIKGMHLSIDKATAHGFGIVGTKNSPTSTGAIGYYAQKIAEKGLIGIVLAQSPEFVAPHGSKQAIFGTNPIAIGIPTTGGSPMVMDMATCAFPYFGLLEARTAGKSIPPNVAMDSDGNLTTDPNAALDGGAIKVFDGTYKGSNLALCVELLAGSLPGAAVVDKMASKSWGNLIIAIDPELLGSPADFKARVDVVLGRVKGAEKMPGVDEILLPGERGDRMTADRLRTDKIPVEPNLLAGVEALAATFEQHALQPPPPPSPQQSSKGFKIATQLVHPTKVINDPYDSTNVPIYQTATFGQPSSTTFGDYDYTRSGNPTRAVLENQMAELEGASRAFAFASGMNALSVVTQLVGSGHRIVTGDDIYGGTSRLLSQVVPKYNIEVLNVDCCDLAAVEAAIDGNTKLVMIESPTNPRMQIVDIAAISKLAHTKGAKGCIVMVDNSIMAPVFQRPLDLGADISMTSATKFICGHSDVTGGILSVKDPELAKEVYFLQNSMGGGLGPFDCWLCIRGLKTMSLRMERQQHNAVRMADFLKKHPLVTKVNFAGMEGTPGAELHWRQASGQGSMLSFTTGDVNVSQVIVEETKLFKITVSFGNVASLISLPCFMSHASIPAEVRAARGLPDDLVRISAGIEDIDDLLADLAQAMDKAAKVAKKAAEEIGTSREKMLLARIQALEEKLGMK